MARSERRGEAGNARRSPREVTETGPARLTGVAGPRPRRTRTGSLVTISERDPRDCTLDACQEIPESACKPVTSRDCFLVLPHRKFIEQPAANRAVLDVCTFVDLEQAKSLLAIDSVAVDQALYLGFGDGRKLAFISVKRAKPCSVGLARQRLKRLDQLLRFRIELLAPDDSLGLTQSAGKLQPQIRVWLLAFAETLFLSKVFGKHAPPNPVGQAEYTALTARGKAST
jgi:hypothetical protein